MKKTHMSNYLMKTLPYMCGKLVKAMDGRRPTSKNRQEELIGAMRATGFVTGSSPFTFDHERMTIVTFVHDDDSESPKAFENARRVKSLLMPNHSITMTTVGATEKYDEK